MTFSITTLGGRSNYGKPGVVAELDDIGEVRVQEIEIESTDDVLTLLNNEEVERIEFSETALNQYEGEITVVCEEIL